MSKHKPFSPGEVAMTDGESYWAAFPRVLNNFFTRFFIGNKPYRCLGDPRGHRGLEDDHWTTIRKDNGEGIYGDSDETSSWYTDKFRNQRPCDFYNEIDSIIVQQGLTVEKVAWIINDAYYGAKLSYNGTRKDRVIRKLEHWFPSYKKLRENRREAKWKLMFETLLPIYIELRKRGYNTYELRA